MVFFANFSKIQNNLADPNLLSVQAGVYSHFEDLRATADEELLEAEALEDEGCNPGKPVGEIPSSKSSSVCPCLLKPDISVTTDDVKSYWSLLRKASEYDDGDSPEESVKREREKEFRKLKKLHERVKKAQIRIQLELLSCEPCVHGGVLPECDRLVFNFVTDRQKAEMLKFPSLYKQLLRVPLCAPNRECHPASLRLMHRHCDYFRFVHHTPYGMVRLCQSAELESFAENKAHHSTSDGLKDGSLPQNRAGIILSGLLLRLLFCRSSLTDVFIPFTLRHESAVTSENPRLLFHDPVWLRPLGSRERAHQFYTLAYEFHCLSETKKGNSDAKLNATGAHAAAHGKGERRVNAGDNTATSDCPSKRTSSIARTEEAIDSPKIIRNRTAQRSEDYLLRSSKGKKQVKRTVAKQSSPPPMRMRTRNSPRSISIKDHLKNKETSSRPTSTSSDTEDLQEADDVMLSIDIEAEPEVKPPVSPSILREVASVCAVVTRRQAKQEQMNTSTPDSPCPEFSEPPASPSSVCADVAEPTETVGTLSDAPVIPLEPVDGFTPSTPVVESDASPAKESCDTESGTSECSYSLMELGENVLLVYYPEVRWSDASSCEACTTQSARLNSKALCPFWPSCSSRQPKAQEVHEGIGACKPVHVQVKPEYLGDWGCEVLSPEELADSWIGSVIRADADILRIRVRANTGELIWAEYQTLKEFLSAHPDFKPEENLVQLSHLFKQLLSLPSGSYLLTQNDNESACSYEVYEALEDPMEMSTTEEQVSSELLDLNLLHKRFYEAFTSVVDLSFAIHNTLGTQQSGTPFPYPWHDVRRLELDLDIPAGVELTTTSDDSGEVVAKRNLRIPALPLQRLFSPVRKTPEVTNSKPSDNHAPSSSQSKRKKNRSRNSKNQSAVIKGSQKSLGSQQGVSSPKKYAYLPKRRKSTAAARL